MKVIKETTLHPEGNDGVDLYPKTSIKQVENLFDTLTGINQTEQNLSLNKLDKPATPTAESAVVLGTDGTVSTKLLSEIGGGKLYGHDINLTLTKPNNTYDIYEIKYYIIDSQNSKYNIDSVYGFGQGLLLKAVSGTEEVLPVYINYIDHEIDPGTGKVTPIIYINSNGYVMGTTSIEITAVRDDVTEL